MGGSGGGPSSAAGGGGAETAEEGGACGGAVEAGGAGSAGDTGGGGAEHAATRRAGQAWGMRIARPASVPERGPGDRKGARAQGTEGRERAPALASLRPCGLSRLRSCRAR